MRISDWSSDVCSSDLNPQRSPLKGPAMAVTDLDLSKYALGWSDAEDYVFKPKKGLNEDIIREMRWLKGEPDWMLDFRLRAYRAFEKRPMPTWGGNMSEIYLDDILYHNKPARKSTHL